MASDQNKVVCLTANMWHDGMEYPIGTPIEVLPAKLLEGLTEASVDGPLPKAKAEEANADDEEMPKTEPRRPLGRPAGKAADDG